ncbi:hypothetical protein RJ639_029473, partial [Escallonia herrerae]
MKLARKSKKFLPHRLAKKIDLLSREFSSRLSYPRICDSKHNEALLLHGHLDLWVKEANNLPNMDLFHCKLKDKVGDVARKLPGKISSRIEEKMSEKTQVTPMSQSYYPYTRVDKVPLYHGGLGASPDYHGVPGTYFPLRRGGKVTLYQDAHVHDGSLPDLKLDNDVPYMHGSCWADIFDGMKKARHLIYIAGWSVYHKVRLVGDDNNETESILGDFLKTKSEEGVRVVLLVWDDFTSQTILGHTHEGKMKTHDEETRKFFKHSSVQLLLCPRHAGKGRSWLKKQEARKIYTHHQKTVIVDADAGHGKRKITAFVGGLDLAMGRYDTPKHPIFTMLQTVHKDDFHNLTFEGPTVGCPREPWHDLHCQIDGPAAYDILTNFEERWQKASELHALQKLKMVISGKDGPMRIERPPEIMGMADAPCLSEDDTEAWHVQ